MFILTIGIRTSFASSQLACKNGKLHPAVLFDRQSID